MTELRLKTPGGRSLQLMNLPKKRKRPDGSWEVTEAQYLPVSERIAWFRDEHPDWSILCSIESTDSGYIACANISDQANRTIARAHKYEAKGDFTDPLEKAETGAIGRALALCGYGTQFALELEEEPERPADAPRETLWSTGQPKHPEAEALDEPEREAEMPPVGGASARQVEYLADMAYRVLGPTSSDVPDPVARQQAMIERFNERFHMKIGWFDELSRQAASQSLDALRAMPVKKR